MIRNYYQQTIAVLFAVFAFSVPTFAQSGATRPRRVNPQEVNDAAAKEQPSPNPAPRTTGTQAPPAQSAGGDTTHAFALFQQGQFAEAAREAKQIAAANPKNSEAWKLAGFAEAGLKQYADAANDLQKALDLQ